MQRTIIGIILISSLTLPFGTVYLFFSFQKIQIKTEVKNRVKTGMEKEDLVMLVFSKEEQTRLRWEHDREFEFNNQMYDIVSFEIKGDSIHYLCYWDQKETEVNQALKKLKGNSPDGDLKNLNPEKRNLQDNVQLLFVEIPSTNYWLYFKKHTFSLYLNRYSNIFYPPPIPPPQGC